MPYPAPLYVALVHSPVLNKDGEIVTTSITTFDIHDSARTARTFGAQTVFLISPIPEQQGLVTYFKDYWTTGVGGARHSSRRQALERIDGTPSLETAIATIAQREGQAPLVIATSARRLDTTPTWTIDEAVSKWRHHPAPLLLLFGTGWGLAPAGFDRCQAMLAPITGPDTYNHLPVRAAIAIYLHAVYSGVSSQRL